MKRLGCGGFFNVPVTEFLQEDQLPQRTNTASVNEFRCSPVTIHKRNRNKRNRKPTAIKPGTLITDIENKIENIVQAS